MVSSDSVYELCLALTIVCAVLAPLGLSRLFSGRFSRARWSMVSAFAVTTGTTCSLPFGRTSELPWLPWIAAIYFPGVLLTAVLFRLAPQDSNQESPTGHGR